MKHRRFEHLEGPRQGAPADHSTSPTESRFETSPLVDSKPGPAAPTSSERFAPETPVVQVDGSPLARLPSLVCAKCQTESSKFDTTCGACGQRLDAPDSVAVNMERLAQFDAEATAALQAAQRARGEALAQEVAKRYDPTGAPSLPHLAPWASAVALTLAMALVPGHPVVRLLVWLLGLMRLIRYVQRK